MKISSSRYERSFVGKHSDPYNRRNGTQTVVISTLHQPPTTLGLTPNLLNHTTVGIAVRLLFSASRGLSESILSHTPFEMYCFPDGLVKRKFQYYLLTKLFTEMLFDNDIVDRCSNDKYYTRVLVVKIVARKMEEDAKSLFSYGRTPTPTPSTQPPSLRLTKGPSSVDPSAFIPCSSASRRILSMYSPAAEK